MVLYRLYRPETQYYKGKHVRDLSKLNRDLSQVGGNCCMQDCRASRLGMASQPLLRQWPACCYQNALRRHLEAFSTSLLGGVRSHCICALKEYTHAVGSHTVLYRGKTASEGI